MKLNFAILWVTGLLICLTSCGDQPPATSSGTTSAAPVETTSEVSPNDEKASAPEFTSNEEKTADSNDNPSSGEEPSADFQAFVDKFYETVPPISFKDAKIRPAAYDAEPLPVELVEAFICNQERSSLLCKADEDDDFSPGMDIRPHFYPAYSVSTNRNYFLFYQLFYLGYGEMVLATYSRSGELLSRINFAGYDSSTETIDGEMDRKISNIYITNRTYEYGHPGEEEYLQGTNIRVVTVDKEGYLLDSNGARIRDEM